MGEAWFMSGRRSTFDDFFARPIAELPIEAFGAFLFELTSGIHSFGDSDGEWSEWLGYCLPDLILRSHESDAFTPLIESTIAAFMNVYWSSELPPIYPTFATDIYSTLGRCLMKPELWIDRATPRLGSMLGMRGGMSDALFWGRTSGDFSAAMFFALRYFPIDSLPRWIDSVLDIAHPAWRARFVTWLWGAAALLRNPVATIHDLERCKPPIEWDNSHCIGPAEGGSGPFIPTARSECALMHFRTRLESVLPHWSFDESPEIARVMSDLGAIDALFDALY